ncbi:hypothetical protein GCM10010413_08470 [Promicromonospora sukumoe]
MGSSSGLPPGGGGGGGTVPDIGQLLSSNRSVWATAVDRTQRRYSLLLLRGMIDESSQVVHTPDEKPTDKARLSDARGAVGAHEQTDVEGPCPERT